MDAEMHVDMAIHRLADNVETMTAILDQLVREIQHLRQQLPGHDAGKDPALDLDPGPVSEFK